MSTRAVPVLHHPLMQEEDVVLDVAADAPVVANKLCPCFREERQLCVHEDGCYRYAMAPPQGYQHNAPMCASHATYADFVAYEDEIADELAMAMAYGHVFMCVGCEKPITLDENKRSFAYRLSCCRMFVCGACSVDVDATCPQCAEDLEVPKEKRHLERYAVLTRPKPTPVEMDPTWGFMKTLARRLEADHRDVFEHYVSQILALREDYEDVEKDTDLSDAERDVYFASLQDRADECHQVLVSVFATVSAIPTLPAFRPLPSEAR